MPNAKIAGPMLCGNFLHHVLRKVLPSKKKKTKKNMKQHAAMKSSLPQAKHEDITINHVFTEIAVPGNHLEDGAWRSIFIDLTKKDSMTYLIFVDRQTYYPEVFELNVKCVWKQTKVALRDVFREYRVPAEILTPEKFLFRSGKFIKFIKDHGIVQITEPNNKLWNNNKLAKVLTSVKSVIHNSRFWHEELRKLRRDIAKSMLMTDEKYVQVGYKGFLSDLSTEEFSESTLASQRALLLDEEATDYYDSEATSSLIGGSTINIQNGNNKTIVENDEDYSWIEKLKCIRIISDRDESILGDGKIIQDNTNAPLIERMISKVHHFSVNRSSTELEGNRDNAQLEIKEENFTKILDSNEEDSKSYETLKETQISSEKRKITLECNQVGSGDAWTVMNSHTMTSAEKSLIIFPIESLKYDNLFITQEDIYWKAVAIDIVNFASKCCCMIIDCATKFTEILQMSENESTKIRFLIWSLCQMWQKHGKPVEIHTLKRKIFTSPKFNQFVQKYNMVLYYDSPFLKDDTELSHIMRNYQQLISRNESNFFNYSEFLKLQNTIRKNIADDARKKQKKKQKTIFSNNETTCSVNKDLKSANNETLCRESFQKLNEKNKNLVKWEIVVVDEVKFKNETFALFINAQTFYPEIKRIEFKFEPYPAKSLVRTLKDFLREKSVVQELHAPDRSPFDMKSVKRFVECKGIFYYRQSQYFNGANSINKCLEHMKSIIYGSYDIPTAVSDCRERTLPWLGLSPEGIASNNALISQPKNARLPWEEVILAVFRGDKFEYLIVFDCASFYSEYFRLRNFCAREMTRAFVKACSVLGTPGSVRTPNVMPYKSGTFERLLKDRKIDHKFLSPEEERDIASIMARIRQKLTVLGNFEAALISTRESYIHFIGGHPARKLREQETEAYKKY